MKTADQKTAKIYAFPARNNQRKATAGAPGLPLNGAVHSTAQTFKTTEFGSASYHEAAIRSERAGKQ